MRAGGTEESVVCSSGDFSIEQINWLVSQFPFMAKGQGYPTRPGFIHRQVAYRGLGLGRAGRDGERAVQQVEDRIAVLAGVIAGGQEHPDMSRLPQRLGG